MNPEPLPVDTETSPRKARLIIYVDPDVPNKLLALADSPRKQGEFISNIVRSVWDNQHIVSTATLDGIRYQTMGVMAELQTLKGRVAMLEAQIHK